MKQNSIFSAFLLEIRPFLLSAVTVISCCMAVTGCAQAQSPLAGNQAQITDAAAQTNTGDAEAIRAQQLQLVKVPLTVTAPVKKMLKYDDRGLPHEKFLLLLSNGSTILVAHNTKMAPYVPLQSGDLVTVSGEYIWNAKGGLIHWTHHSDTPNHKSGYIDFNGKRYE
ncbi:MAG: DUF3465 domain-containing protein [Candidatus Obscuribacterales bacterium]|nr:DUF3465 domain-containing protein [Candidatus Obscuribacterales bacterium]